MNSFDPSPSSAHVKIVTANNATFQEAYQFDDPNATGWNFTGKTFRLDIKANREATSFLLSFTSPTQIIVDDAALRVLHFNVPEATFDPTVIPPGFYVYDLIMTDAFLIRTPLMHGDFEVTDGITGG